MDSNDESSCICIFCPHCDGPIIVSPKEINCRIFRHGTFRSNGQPIPPHSPKDACDLWVQQELIWGCGKPFQLIPTSPKQKDGGKNENDKNENDKNENDKNENDKNENDKKDNEKWKAVKCDYI